MPYYAVKSNNIPHVLKELYQGGCGFDCASSHEIQSVFSIGSKNIIFANPCKSRKELFFAKKNQIKLMTFDSIEEIEKIMEIYPDAMPILRIFVDDRGGARIPLNKKFGIHINQVHTLLHREPFFKIYGLAFHVGSDCTSVESYKSAFKTVRDFLSVFKQYPNVFQPHILDIGGGFSGHSKNDSFFTELSEIINKEIKSLPFERTIAEPGRFFAEESCTLHVPVIGRKILSNGEKCITIDESVYGIFSGVLFDGFKPKFQYMGVPYSNLEKFTVFGRTCDSADKIAEGVWLPREINDSDTLEVKNIGAYSWVSSSEFNGFSKPTTLVLF